MPTSAAKSPQPPLAEGHEQVRVRFAPNGEMPCPAFITRTVLYSWLFARHYGGTFILRLDDTDVDRQTPGTLQSYPDALRWLGLHWDEGPEVGGGFGPYRQSERLHLYREAVETLLASGHAYRCYCSPGRLAEVAAAARRPGSRHRAYDGRCRQPARADIEAAARENRAPAIRLRVPDSGAITSIDLLRGPVTVPVSQLSDFVICRPDGWPTYHLTVVVDDSLMRISHVIRGIEGLSNMAPQAVMHRALGLEPPLYLHHPLVRTPGFTIGDRFLPTGDLLYVDELRRAGTPPQAVVNYYGLLGYGDGDSREIRTLDEMVEGFDYTRISRKEFVNQSLPKLAWMTRTYLRSAAPTGFVEEIITERLTGAGVSRQAAERLACRAAPVLRTRLSDADEILDLLDFAVRDPRGRSQEPEAALWAKAAVAALADGEDLVATAKELAGGDRDAYGRITRALLAMLGASGTRLPLRDCVAVLGRDEALRRWRRHAA
ncbi:glutamate--tRNA ligase [Actinacidiphila yeochonensis]|uniref:glutamate--tRNA ligase n=1 Tax=Actinacidiphila yeochonensis TaxID=89050 RepID=UPI000691E959|nr:glutamate--tRNA ligase [Actinacidiphila yeochonensis]